MRFLLLGGTGQVGSELRELPRRPGVEIVAPGRERADLAKPETLARIVAEGRWDGVINAAAYTNVDLAESERSAAFAVNAEGPACLAAETGRRGIPLIHVSTDYVFDGRKGAPYVERDRTAPLNVYGSSKLAGETGVCTENPRHVVLRTAWVFSPFGKNFVKTMLRLAGERDRLSIVSDQHGSPTAARDVAQACLDIALRCAETPEHARYGLYHFAGGGHASRFEFTQAIVALAKGRLGRAPEVVMGEASEHRAAAERPADTRLDCSAIANAFGVTPKPWRESLRETIERMPTIESVQ